MAERGRLPTKAEPGHLFKNGLTRTSSNEACTRAIYLRRLKPGVYQQRLNLSIYQRKQLLSFFWQPFLRVPFPSFHVLWVDLTYQYM